MELKPVSRAQKTVAGMSTLVLVSGISVAIVPTSAQAATYVENFPIECTQENVNGGLPFGVQVEASLTLPDVIYPGDELFPEVTLAIELPTEVADVINLNGYDTLEGNIDATVQVIQNGVSETKTAFGFPLTATPVPNPSAPFVIQTSPSFSSYTPTGPTEIVVQADGAFVNLTNVVVSNVQGNSFNLGPFNCSTLVPTTIFTIQVSEPPTPVDPIPPVDPAPPVETPLPVVPTAPAPGTSSPRGELPVVSG